MMNAEDIYAIFKGCVADYHKSDHVDAPQINPYIAQSFENLLYKKCRIDTIQWHLEDIIRDPQISPEEALLIKRRIDKSNQDRTDLVEKIDDYFMEQFLGIKATPEARLNTESPAWAIDRLSILALKIYHMEIEVSRQGISEQLKKKNSAKLQILKEQQKDLILSINQLLEDIAAGHRIMKVYRQMKMYNDPALNPVLYAQNKS